MNVAAFSPLIILLLGFVVYCLVDLIRSRDTQYLPKWVWALIILLSVPLGGIVYLFVGRTTRVDDAG